MTRFDVQTHPHRYVYRCRLAFLVAASEVWGAISNFFRLLQRVASLLLWSFSGLVRSVAKLLVGVEVNSFLLLYMLVHVTTKNTRYIYVSMCLQVIVFMRRGMSAEPQSIIPRDERSRV